MQIFRALFTAILLSLFSFFIAIIFGNIIGGSIGIGLVGVPLLLFNIYLMVRLVILDIVEDSIDYKEQMESQLKEIQDALSALQENMDKE